MAKHRSPKRQDTSQRPGRPRARDTRLAALLLLVSGALVYANSLHGPFIFDDRRTITDNTTIRQLWPLTTVLRPERQTAVAGRPIANLSFAINHALGGERVEGYHVWNIAIHILAALTL